MVIKAKSKLNPKKAEIISEKLKTNIETVDWRLRRSKELIGFRINEHLENLKAKFKESEEL